MSKTVNVKVTNNIGLFKNAMETQKAAALEAVGLQAEKNAKKEITDMRAVDTGRLRASISHAKDDDAAYIGTNVEYAPYIELGTSKMKPRPYLRNAAANYTEKYKKIIESKLKS